MAEPAGNGARADAVSKSVYTDDSDQSASTPENEARKVRSGPTKRKRVGGKPERRPPVDLLREINEVKSREQTCPAKGQHKELAFGCSFPFLFSFYFWIFGFFWIHLRGRAWVVLRSRGTGPSTMIMYDDTNAQSV